MPNGPNGPTLAGPNITAAFVIAASGAVSSAYIGIQHEA